MRKKIVILSTFFPPNNHIASSRILAFAETLSKYFDVTVITSNEKEEVISSDSYKIIYLNNGFLDLLVKINGNESYFYRFFKIFLRKFFSYCGFSFYTIWSSKAKKILEKTLNEQKTDFILSSYMPIDCHNICYDVLLSDIKFEKIYWIADMRDELSSHYDLNEKERVKVKKYEENLSKRINLVVSVSEPILNQFKKNMPYASNYLEVRNGYSHNIKCEYVANNRLKIGYFGSFYGEIKPDNFFKALLGFKYLESVEIYIASKVHNYSIPNELKPYVKSLAFMSYEDSIKMMSNMDCNLLILPFSGKREGVYSGKLFDYISTTRPTLALISKVDVAAKLLNECNSGYIADPNNINEINDQLINIYNNWKNGKLSGASLDKIEELRRDKQVEKLASYLLNVK